MRTIVILLLCLSVQACRTVEPELKRKMEAIQIPEIDFRQAKVSDVIAFLVETSHDYDPTHDDPRIRLSLVLDPSEQKREDEERERKYARLQQHCAGKTITLNLRYCSLLNLLDFVTRYAGVEYELKENRIIIKTADGNILVEE
jgi:hypothetical protein